MKKVINKKVLFCILFLICILLIYSGVYFSLNINLIGNKDVYMNINNAYFENGYSASVFNIQLDNVKVDNNVDIAKIGDYEVKYEVGILGLRKKIIRNVHVVDRKKPDIKWTRKPEDIFELQKIQMEILEKCSDYLKPGGRLVYSTCTILKQENEEQVEKFLKVHDNFKLIEQINLFPHTDGADGFFIAVLERI